MVGQYLAKFYLPASRQGRRYFEGDFAAAREVAAWKGLIRECWSKVRLRRLDAVRNDFVYGDSMRVEIAVHLNGLKPDYVIVELVLGRQTQYDTLPDNRRYRFEWEGVMTEQGEHQFVLDIRPELCGDLDYRIRVYPWHELLSHPFEMGLMWWL
jgi:starch phosphorylase